MTDKVTVPISSGFVRGGANANPDWAIKALGKNPVTVDWGSDKLHAAIAEEATPKPDLSITLLESEKAMGRTQAVQSGYTGDQCSNCSSMRMKISGHCMVCEDCGTTTGCS